MQTYYLNSSPYYAYINERRRNARERMISRIPRQIRPVYLFFDGIFNKYDRMIMKIFKNVPIAGAVVALLTLYATAGLIFATSLKSTPEPYPDLYFDSPLYAEQLHYDIDAEEECYGEIFDGMFFSAEYVLEEYEYDGVYVVIYDDPDASIHNCPVTVNRATYERVMEAIETGEGLVGHLEYLHLSDSWMLVEDKE